MAIFDFKAQFRALLAPYLKEIKARIGAVEGTLVASEATVAAFPTTDVDNGDWAILTSDDGTNESGIYSWNGTAWGFAADISSFTEIVSEIFGSAADVTTGTATDKAMSIVQLFAAFAKIGGDAAQKFLAAAPEENSSEVTRSADFAVDITDGEAQADYAAA